MKLWHHLLVFVPVLLLVYHLEAKLRDHQWVSSSTRVQHHRTAHYSTLSQAFAAVEDKLVTFPLGAVSESVAIPVGTWACISSPQYHSHVVDKDFGLTSPGSLILHRKVAYCQTEETSTTHTRTVRHHDGSTSEEHYYTYSYHVAWSHRLIDSRSFDDYQYRNSNPAFDPYPTSTIHSSNLRLGPVSVPTEMIPLLIGGNTDGRLPTQAIGQDSAAATSGFTNIDKDGYSHYSSAGGNQEQHGGSWWSSRPECNIGDIRVSWQSVAPQGLTAIGRVTADHQLEPIEVAHRGLRPVAILHAGEVAPEQAFTSAMSPLWWMVIPTRLLLLLLCVCEARAWSRQLGIWWADTQLYAALVCALGGCVSAVILALIWCFIYGLSDWRGQETSAPQLWLLLVACTALTVLGLASQRSGSAVVASLARVSVRLNRVSDSLFNIASTTPDEQQQQPATNKLQTGGLLAAIVAGSLLSVLALAGGSLNSSNHWLVWAVGCGITALAGALMLATMVTKERVDHAPQSHGGPSGVGDTSMDCPICLESVSAAEGLILDPCGHTVCVECFTAMSQSSSRGKCPVCRADVEKTIMLNRQVDQTNEFMGQIRPPS